MASLHTRFQCKQGTEFFSSEATYRYRDHDVECFTMSQLLDTYESLEHYVRPGGSTAGNGSDAACLSASELNCKSPLRLGGPDECARCDILCPLAAFDSIDFMKRAEVYPAAISMPLLVLILVLEVYGPLCRAPRLARSGAGRSSSASSSKLDKYMLLSVVCGLVHGGLVLAAVAPAGSLTGCSDDGSFTYINPLWWSSPDQMAVCSAMKASVHVLQLLMCSVACFVVHTYWRFEAAVSFAKIPRWRSLLFDGVFLLIVPGAATLVTVMDGKQTSGDFFDPCFAFAAIRHVVKCGPSFHNVWIELLVVEGPVMVAIATTMVAAVAQRRLCRRIVKYQATAKATSVQVAQMRRMALQMHVFSTGCFFLMVAKVASAALLRTQVVQYVAELSRFIACSHHGTYFGSNCEDPASHSSGWESFALTASILSWSTMPALFAAFFAGVLATRATSAGRRIAPTHSNSAIASK